MFIDKPMLVFSHKSGWTSWLFWVLHGSWALFLFASPTIRLLLHSSSVLFFSHRPPPSDTAACVLSSFSHVWLFVTPWIAAHQARTLEWIAMHSSRGSFQPGDWTWVSCITGRFFNTGPLGKPSDTGVSKSTSSSYWFYRLCSDLP